MSGDVAPETVMRITCTPAWYGHKITLNSQGSLRSSRDYIGPERNMQTEKEVHCEELDYKIIGGLWKTMVSPKSGRLETQWYRGSLKPSVGEFPLAQDLLAFLFCSRLQLIG